MFKAFVFLIFAHTSCALNIVSRSDWNAKQPSETPIPLKVHPATYVVVHHTATQSCLVETKCKRIVKSIQTYHIDSRRWSDIGYNFLIGEDGNVYEGRGWGITGAHAKNYNNKSIGVSFIGTFQDNIPNAKALDAFKDLIKEALERNKISSNYKLIGHKQVSPTLCPGQKFYEEVKKMPNWSPSA